VRRLGKGIVAAVLASIVLGGAAASFLAWDWHRPYRREAGETRVSISRGDRAGDVVEVLHERGLVRHRVSFKLAFVLYGNPRKLRPGTYRFDRPLSPLEVIGKLNRGDVELTRMTIPEGLRTDEVIGLLAASGIGSEEAFRKAVRDPGPILDLDPAARDLEGYLFPETYLLDPGLSEKAVVDILVRSFRSWWASAAGPGRDRGIREVVTLASLVEEETASAPERPLIAGVFENRLRLGMALQTDPSVVYALSLAGRYSGTLRREDLAFESPYNTYRNAGLPPGPICSPGRASLEAVLKPQASPYLYFVSRNDGTHAFSRTLEEHNRWVALTRRARTPRGR
jgi:UPF0755 protein